MSLGYDVDTDALYREGFKLGTVLAKERIAIRCLNIGKSYQETADITGLTMEQVAKIDANRRVDD